MLVQLSMSQKPNKQKIKMIENQARKVLPLLGRVKKDWIGFRPTLPDSLPVIGHSLQNKRILYITLINMGLPKLEKISSNRSFGLVFFAVFLIISLWPL